MTGKRLLICGVVLMALGASAHAQTTTTEILGVVTDSNGAVVQGAKVPSRASPPTRHAPQPPIMPASTLSLC